MIHRILCSAEPAGIWHRKLTTVQQELFGQGVVRLSPQGQCNWGYHRLYAAIHHSESKISCNTVSDQLAEIISENPV
jgi:hypothetical protein